MYSAIRAKLIGATGVTNLVSTRVYMTNAYEGAALPYIVFSTETNEHVRHMGGVSGLVSGTVDIEVFDTTPQGAKGLQEAVRNTLDDFSGSTGGVQIRHVILDSMQDEYEPPADGQGAGTHGVSMSFDVWYEESIPG